MDVYEDCRNDVSTSGSPQLLQCQPNHATRPPGWFRRLLRWAFPRDCAYLTDKLETKQVVLTGREQITHDTMRLVFSIPNQLKLGINCGQHIMCHHGDQQRAYTPTTNACGHFEVVVKMVPGGTISRHLHQMAVGQTLLISGPAGRYSYSGNGVFASSLHTTIRTKQIMCVCAGSGITPIYAVLKRIEHADTTVTCAKLLFVNKTTDDIILHPELDDMCMRIATFECHYALTQPHPEWDGLVGRPSIAMIADIANAARDEIVLICGSKMFNRSISDICLELGYEKNRILMF